MSARDEILRAVHDARAHVGARGLPDVPATATALTSEEIVATFVTASRAAGADVEDGGAFVAPPSAFVCEGGLGVAENGAVWLPLSRLRDRAEAFLADHVVIMLDRSAIVADMHAAYARIDPRAEVFGTFMAGPSKTADVEQSLVIGAHGPRRVTVVLRG